MKYLAKTGHGRPKFPSQFCSDCYSCSCSCNNRCGQKQLQLQLQLPLQTTAAVATATVIILKGFGYSYSCSGTQQEFGDGYSWSVTQPAKPILACGQQPHSPSSRHGPLIQDSWSRSDFLMSLNSCWRRFDCPRY